MAMTELSRNRIVQMRKGGGEHSAEPDPKPAQKAPRKPKGKPPEAVAPAKEPEAEQDG